MNDKFSISTISENPISSSGYSDDITSLLRELKLDVPLTPAHGPDVRDTAKHLSMTQERLRKTIMFEIEQNKSPNSKGLKTPLAHVLSNQFDSTAPGTSSLRVDNDPT